MQLEYADSASLGAWWNPTTWGKAAPETLTPEERNRRTSIVQNWQSLKTRLPAVINELERFENAHGRASSVEARRILAREQIALADAEGPVTEAYRRAVEAGAIKQGEGLGAFPLLAVAVILIIVLFFAAGTWVIHERNVTTAQLEAKRLDEWLAMAQQRFSATGQLPPAPAAASDPTDAIGSGFKFGTVAILAGLAFMFLGKRR